MTARAETVIAFPNIRGKRVEPPVNVLPMAACVQEQGIMSARVIDGESLKMTPRQLAEEMLRNRPPLAGLSVYTPALPNAFEVARHVKEMRPDVVTVMGGKHATHYYPEILQNPDIDIVAVGEGEETYPMMVEARSQGGIDYMRQTLEGRPGIAFPGNTGVSLAPKVDLKKLPPLDFSLLHPDIGYYLRQDGLIIDMESARGCFGKCRFCIASRYRNGISFKDPNRFVDEMEYVTRMHKGDIYLTDDDFLVNYRHTKAVLSELKRRGIHPHIEANARADSFLKCYQKDPHILEELKEAGVDTLHIGVESANLQMMEYVGKRVSLTDIEQTVRIGTGAGLTIVTNFIVGMPYDNEETIRDSIRFAQHLKQFGPHLAHVSIFMPYPGTDMYDDAIQEGLVDPRTLPLESLYDVHKGAIIPTKYLTTEQINTLYNEFHDTFFTPQYLSHIMQYAPQAYTNAQYMAKKRIN